MTNKKKKNKKKIKECKTLEEREKQVDVIMSKLSELGISNEFNFMKELKQECDKYVKDGIAWSGKIKMHGLKRIMNVILTTRKHTECSLVLMYNENV